MSLSSTSTLADVPLMPFGGGGERNAVPIYDIEECIVDYRFSAHSPLRTSALRSLGAHGNVFAIESMLDELAAAVGMEPLAIRLRNLKGERSVAVLEAVGWFACVVEVELSHGLTPSQRQCLRSVWLGLQSSLDL